MQRAPGLYYGPSDIHSRGVFCSHPLSEGDVIEICPMIVLSAQELLLMKESTLYGYYYVWGEEQDHCAIALGFGSLYNHDADANAEFTPDYGDDTLLITANREIPAGTEITIDYQVGAVERELWF